MKKIISHNWRNKKKRCSIKMFHNFHSLEHLKFHGEYKSHFFNQLLMLMVKEEKMLRRLLRLILSYQSCHQEWKIIKRLKLLRNRLLSRRQKIDSDNHTPSSLKLQKMFLTSEDYIKNLLRQWTEIKAQLNLPIRFHSISTNQRIELISENTWMKKIKWFNQLWRKDLLLQEFIIWMLISKRIESILHLPWNMRLWSNFEETLKSKNSTKNK